MNKKMVIILLCFYMINSCKTNTSSRNIKSSLVNFDTIYPIAIRGKVDKVIDIINKFPEEKLNDRELEIKQKFIDRFVDETELEENVKDSTMLGITKRFRSYWRSVMMDRKTANEAQKELLQSLISYIYLVDSVEQSKRTDEIKSSLGRRLDDYISRRGYFSNASGKTGHLHDLFLWKEQTEKTYNVQLIDTTINVNVIFMKDFLSLGWGHYATLGRSYASGWTTKTALYCMHDGYDTSSEHFKVSYLAHEGQHFSDNAFVKLKQTDREYRAKLVELAKAETTMMDLVKNFISNGINDSNYAHGYANYCVMKGLSKELFNSGSIVKNIQKWEELDKSDIHEKSKGLLKLHTKKMLEIGKDLVVSVL